MCALKYNGSALVAMAGDKCVSIGTDKRYGLQSFTISTEFPKVFEMGPHLYIGVPGLTTDMQTAVRQLRFRKNLFELQERRRMPPRMFSALVSTFLYERRLSPLFIEPIVVGLEPHTFEPYICSLDIIGCRSEPGDFVKGGSAGGQLIGMCEALWNPNMGPDDLFESTSQALLNAFDRDAVSGWGGIVYVIEKDKVTVRELKSRMD